MRTGNHIGLWAAVLAAAAFACGTSTTESGAGPSDAGAQDAGDGFQGQGTTGGSSDPNAPGGLGPNATCGGKPCANHTGARSFDEPDAPAGAAAAFDGVTPTPAGTDGAKEPAVVYPNHETMFPINVSHVHHQWLAAGNDRFRLEFVGPKTTVRIHTAKTSWEPTDEQWDWLAESNRGSVVHMTVYGMRGADLTRVYASRTVDLSFSDSEVEGGIYYWSTGSAGIMKALVSDRTPSKFYTDPAAPDGKTCVACHTLSKDGKRLAVGYGGEKLRQVSVPARATVLPANGGAAMASGWTTFSPDGTKLLVASAGKLTLIDSDTGAPVGPNGGVVTLPAGKLASHPDWSALGDRVVITLATKVGNKDVTGGAIAVLPYANGAWGTPEIVVSNAGGTDNNFFPVFSPDSKWIAYVNARGSSKDAASAVLRIVPSAGGAPVTLTRLNQRVNNQDGVTGVGNSMPTWAPSTRVGVFWLAFSSLRAYATLRPQDAKKDQIWIAAIDPAKVDADPGYAGFWAPFQSMDEGNHRAFWTHVASDTQCRCVEICGDGIDNNCNGVADEAPCSTCAEKEICGDGIDNNCDCVVDNCADTEICNDGIDNDGDGLTDGDDPQCTVIR